MLRASILALLLSCGNLFATEYVVVVFDTSGSMSGFMSGTWDRRIDVAKESFFKVFSNDKLNINLGVLTFHGWIYPISPIDPTNLKKSIDSMECSGSTPLGEYMKIGTDALLDIRKKDRFSSFRLILFTDGEANDKHLVDVYLNDILSRGMIVNVIGFDMDVDNSLTKNVNSYHLANNAKSLQDAFQSAIAEVSFKDANFSNETFEMLNGFDNQSAKLIIDKLADTQTNNDPITDEVKSPLSNNTNNNNVNANVGFVNNVIIIMMVFFVAGVISIIASDIKRR